MRGAHRTHLALPQIFLILVVLADLVVLAASVLAIVGLNLVEVVLGSVFSAWTLLVLGMLALARRAGVVNNALLFLVSEPRSCSSRCPCTGTHCRQSSEAAWRGILLGCTCARPQGFLAWNTTLSVICAVRQLLPCVITGASLAAFMVVALYLCAVLWQSLWLQRSSVAPAGKAAAGPGKTAS